MPEFFVRTVSKPAPFVGDEGFQYAEGPSPQEVLLETVGGYKHPFRLYGVRVYANADAYHKGESPLAEWVNEPSRKKYAVG